jgi:hypothetical protein
MYADNPVTSQVVAEVAVQVRFPPPGWLVLVVLVVLVVLDVLVVTPAPLFSGEAVTV